jgi:Methane oxygenase PmoA
MIKRLIGLLALLVFSCSASWAQGRVTFQERPGKVDVLIDGQPFTTLHYGTDWPKPFFHPVRASSGLVITRGFPLEKNPGESNDHHWHRGLWFAHGDINGIDFWRETSGDKVKDAKLLLPVGRIVAKGKPIFTSGKDSGIITAEFDLLTPEQKALGTIWEQYTIRRAGANNLIDVHVVIRADRGTPLKMGDTEEGLLGFRFADEFRQDRGAILSNSDRLVTAEKIWGKRARWVDYSTTLKGERAGLSIFDHPDNPKHPTYWHARGYGLCSANPFGEHDFHNDKSRDGSVTIPSGGNLVFRYRLVIHPGAADASAVDHLYTAFAQGK